MTTKSYFSNPNSYVRIIPRCFCDFRSRAILQSVCRQLKERQRGLGQPYSRECAIDDFAFPGFEFEIEAIENGRKVVGVLLLCLHT
jgi:hypothetical protein